MGNNYLTCNAGKVFCANCDNLINAGKNICDKCGKKRRLNKEEMKYLKMKIVNNWEDDYIPVNRSTGRGGERFPLFEIDSGDYNERNE